MRGEERIWSVRVKSGTWQRILKWAMDSSSMDSSNAIAYSDFLARNAMKKLDSEIRGGATMHVHDETGEVVAQYRVWRTAPDNFEFLQRERKPWDVMYTGLEGKLRIERVEE